MPVVSFSTDSDAAYVVSHCGFFMFNILNVLYIFLFEWNLFGNMNTLNKINIAACIVQVFSCMSSIHRYNVSDPFGPYGKFGTATGLIAFTQFNVLYSYLAFYWDHPKYVKFAWPVMILLSGGCFVISMLTWEEKNFAYFRVYIGLSTIWQVAAMTIGLLALKKKKIRMHASAGMSDEAMEKLLMTLIVLQTVIFGAGVATSLPIIIYPGVGFSFSAMTILMKYVAKMDHIVATFADQPTRLKSSKINVEEVQRML